MSQATPDQAATVIPLPRPVVRRTGVWSSVGELPRFLSHVTCVRALNSRKSEGFGYLFRTGLLPRGSTKGLHSCVDDHETSPTGDPGRDR